MSPILQGGRLRFAGVTVPVSRLGATVPPFPSPLRAPSLYKPCRGGGSPGGVVVAASGREGEVYFVYE